jgi:hypothetical protein
LPRASAYSDSIESEYALVVFEWSHFLRPAFARRSIKPNHRPCHGFAQAAKPVSTFPENALVMPEKSDQYDDRNRHSQQPQENTATKSHDGLRLLEVEVRQATLRTS